MNARHLGGYFVDIICACLFVASVALFSVLSVFIVYLWIDIPSTGVYTGRWEHMPVNYRFSTQCEAE